MEHSVELLLLGGRVSSSADTPSVLFLGRRVYVGFVVVLLAAMTHGLSPRRVEAVREALGADHRTLGRWRSWWLETFAEGDFWKGARARFIPPLCHATLPWSLCARFGVERHVRLLALLRFLSSITTLSFPLDHAL